MIKVEIDDRASPALAELGQRADDLTPVIRSLGELLVDSTHQRFQAGRAPDGTPWAPLTLATLARKRDPRPLFGESRRLSSEIGYEAGSDFVDVGSGLVCAAVHQFGAAKGAFGRTRRGAPIPWGDIPVR